MAVKFNLPRRGARVEWRVFFLAFIVLLGLGGLVLKLWWEQVARGPMWAKKIAGRSEVTVRIPSVRGEIRDRNGIPLVTNRASYEVDFYLPDMVRGYKQQNQHTKIPTITYRGSVKGMAKDKAEADIVQIVNSNVIPRLQDLDLASDYNSEHLRKHYRNDTEVPFAYREEIDFKTLARFSEHDVGLPGVDIAIRPVRQYVYGALAAHLLGYVGMPNNIDELPDVRNYSFYQPDVEGKSQIEASMEKYLRGTPGVRVLQRSVKGQIEGESKRIEPLPGANVYLTLDARIQYIVEQALRHPALGRAAAVVVDVNNGDILAMATVPSFDPNIFIPSV
jgi:penicillin-binding protein 2